MTQTIYMYIWILSTIELVYVKKVEAINDSAGDKRVI